MEVFMTQHPSCRYAIDSASILFLAQMRRDHSNIFRFSVELTETVCPKTLQQAVNAIHPRFPTLIAGFRSGLFHYIQVPSKFPPTVQPDPGCLITMSREELHRCAYRVYYQGNRISIEAFHALTDGHGAIASLTALTAEYLRLKHGIHTTAEDTLIDLTLPTQPHETEDSFLRYTGDHSRHVPSRFAYQLPGGKLPRETIHVCRYNLPVNTLLETARRHGTTVNTLLSTLMADTIMEIQKRQSPKKLLPVRIMVPVNLRKLFPSRTLRNFSYYVLPTLEPETAGKPLRERLHSFHSQIETQLQKDQLSAVITNNVRLQNSWYFRIIPLPIKCILMRLICSFFGERTSSITVTNLGNVQLPQSVAKYVTHMEVTLTPRILSPYGCTVLSYNGNLSIHISRFTENRQLEDIFFQKLTQIIDDKEDI